SVASDLYAVGRTLAMLILNFRGNRTEYRHRLPPVVDHPPLARYDSLYRFLRKATAELPDDRFTSADEMHDELLGVLREVVAAEGGRPAPAPSRVFTPDRSVTLNGTGALRLARQGIDNSGRRTTYLTRVDNNQLYHPLARCLSDSALHL